MSHSVYQQHGIRFEYPPEWILAEDVEGDAISIQVSSPETSFWSITLLPARPAPDLLLESAIEAFADYDDFDAYRSEGEICEYPALFCDIEFVSFELINSGFLRAFRTGRYSILILYQGNDLELEYTLAEFESMTASLVCDLDDDVLLA